MSTTYGTTTIPSDEITVQSGGTVDVSAAFERTVMLVGGMDTANGSASTGQVVSVDSPSAAQNEFGDGSELHEATKIAYNNGAAEVDCYPVSETSVTDQAEGSSATGTLTEAPIFDPNIHDEHSITVDDTGGGSLTINIVYDEGSNLSAPSGTDEININPVTGEYEADSSADGSDYEFDFTHGDYSTSELSTAVDNEDRIVCVLTENESVASDLATELNNNAQNNFIFQHGVVGAAPKLGGDSSSSYSDGLDEQRLSAVYPPRGYINDAEDDMHRTLSGVAGYLSSLELGISSTNDSIGGYTALDPHDSYNFSEAGDLVDVQVMPLWDYPPVTIIKDMTTSTTQKFERVYAMDVVDEAIQASHDTSREFIGGQNTNVTRNQLERSHRNAYLGFRDSSPPLIDDFAVNVSENSSNANQVDVEIGLKVVDVMDVINVTITVGDIISNSGAT